MTPPGAERGPIPDAWLDRLESRIAWRGPDGRGRWRDLATRRDGSVVEAAFVHARLSIIDLECGHQPMVSERGPVDAGAGVGGLVSVIFNGCIYNHQELRSELQRHGHAFRTDHSDTEVLLHGWRQWREALADHLDGMYAIAIWDRDRAECVLLRDRSGEKPLYYATFDDGRALVFASVLPGVLDVLRAAGGPRPEIDAASVVDWMRLGWGERLPLTHVVESEPRQTLRFPARDGGGVGVVHSIELAKERSHGHRLDADGVERLLERSIGLRTYADVSLGCFLSGGVDSSLIALYAKERLGRLTTLCVRFDDGVFDESAYAQEVAKIVGSDHVTIDVRPSAAADFVSLLGLIGLPYSDSSLLPTHWACDAAKQHVKVALAGDGGDELFFGYRRHKAALLLRRWRALVPLLPRRIGGARLDGASGASRLLRFLVTIRAYGYRSMLGWSVPEILGVFPGEAGRIMRETPEFPDPAMDDFVAYMRHDLMRKADTASMASSIEVRAPFLSNGFIEAAQREPIESLMTGGRLKGVLKDLMERHFPGRLVHRRKHGFGVPVGRYFREDFGGMGGLLRDMLAGPAPFGPLHEAMEIDMKVVRRIVDDHMEGRCEHGGRLYGLVALAIWTRQLASAS